MPVFEYRCSECNTKFEVLHKSSKISEEVICPACNSNNNKKLFSTFSASITESTHCSGHGHCDVSSCGNGSCGCNSGMCGLE